MSRVKKAFGPKILKFRYMERTSQIKIHETKGEVVKIYGDHGIPGFRKVIITSRIYVLLD